ncbi:hypothetical protein M231_00407 [Tremella mesenterica]|uniref:Enoyl reductase (ER) domain-containing protein n=1 Tax=Tremella mesenterica TaxID=5217 RepID=A0A4V1M528_TREME|nr:hypothetical protein M231_00407 [Tremella mesenterica]
MSLPTTQKKYTLESAATPERPKAFKITYHSSAPFPTLPTPTSVLVNVKALALSARDLQIVKGEYPAPHAVHPGTVPVGSGAGEIVAVGPEVKGYTVGDRVILMGMPGHHFQPDLPQSSLERSRGGGTDGTAQEYIPMEYEDLLLAPSHLDWIELAGLCGSSVTSWVHLWGHQPLLPGSTVLCLGTGGVSMYAAQFALVSGSSVIITSSSDEKLAKVKKILEKLLIPGSSKDAIRTINYNTTPEWDVEVRKMTGGRGVDNVIEVGGWGTCAKSVRSVRKGGIVGVSGYLSTYHEVPMELKMEDLSKLILYSAANVRGIFVGNRTQAEQMLRFVDRAGLRPVVSEVYDFADLPKAYEAMEKASHIGKVVVRVSA